MSSKFLHAPGLPGFGTAGQPGTDGSVGLSMYFTNLNGIEDKIVIKNKIIGNTSLWASSVLPNNRSYHTGDTFVDKQGKVYEIRLDRSDRFVSTGTSLTISEIFAVYSGATNDAGVTRYSNQYVGTYNIVDSVFSNTISEYTANPANIYGIKPANFARVEFSDLSPESGYFNPFSLFTSGTNANNAIALVRNKNTNQFRLGNLDASLKTRNVDLVFDVHELLVTKDSSSYFTADTPEGAILTNYELKIKNLVDPVFKRDASSFTWNLDGTAPTTDVSIYWNLNDITGTTDMATIAADLYVYQDLAIAAAKYNFSNMSINSSTMVFHGIDQFGVVGIGGLLAGKTYTTYIKVLQNGWERETDRIKIYPGISVLLDISLGSLNATTLACASTGGTYYLDISSNVLCNITTTGDTWMHPSRTVDVSGYRATWVGTHDVSIVIDVHSASEPRYANIDVKGGGQTRTIAVTQTGVVLPTEDVSVKIVWDGDMYTSNDGFTGSVMLKRVSDDVVVNYWSIEPVPPAIVNSYYPLELIDIEYGTYYIDATDLYLLIDGVDAPSYYRYWTGTGQTYGNNRTTSYPFTISSEVSANITINVWGSNS